MDPNESEEAARLREKLRSLESLRGVSGAAVIDQNKAAPEDRPCALVDTDGGAYICGNVDTGGNEFVGRDKHEHHHYHAPPDSNVQKLETAIRSGDAKAVKCLLQAGLSPDSEINGKHCLNFVLFSKELALETKIDILQALLSLDKLPQTLGSVAHYALEKQSKEDLTALLQAGTPIQIKDTDGQSLAARAMRMDDQVGQHGQKWTALLMKEAVDLPSPHATWVLLWSAAKGRRRVVEILLEKGFPVDARLDGSLPEEIIDEDELSYWWPGGTALHFAISKSVPITKLLLERGASPNVRDGLGRTPMHIAAKSKAVKAIRLLLEWSADPTIRDESGNSPLVDACPDRSILEILLNATIAPDHKEKVKLLHRFLDQRNVECIEMLLKSGADPNVKYENCSSALFRLTYWWKSVFCNDLESRRCLELLLKYGSNIGMTDNSGTTALHHIVANPDVEEEVQKLLDAGADPNAADYAGRTPLMKCASQPVAERLIAAGALPIQRDRLGFNASDWATMRGLSELAAWFVDLKIKPSPTARLVAVTSARQHDEVKKLLSSGVEPDTVDGYGQPVIHLAARLLFHEILTLLLDKGAKVDSRDFQGRTALWKCIVCNDLKPIDEDSFVATLKLLLDRGASPTNIDGCGNAAIFFGYRWWIISDVSQRLLDLCHTSQNSKSKTALMAAVERGTFEKVKRLVEKTDDLDATDQQGWTALFWAVQREDLEQEEIINMVKLLLDSGASVEPCDHNGETPLFGAARCKEPEKTSLLLEKGASVSHTNNKGETALFDAVRNKRVKTLLRLIDAGAETEHINREGLSVRAVALKSGNAELVNQLGHFVSS